MSTTLKKATGKGQIDGTVSVSDAVFGIDPNSHVVYLAVRRELNSARAGTACAKTRAEVRGGGRKPWKQKGTGRARAGSIRSPLWPGGGVIFGPKPRDFSFSLPKKVRQLAVRSVLSDAREKFIVVEDYSFINAPKTKLVASFLNALELQDKKVLLYVDYKQAGAENVLMAARNINKLKVALPLNVSVKTLLDVDAVVIDQASLAVIQEQFQSTGKAAVKPVRVRASASATAEKAEAKPAAKKAAAKPVAAKAAPKTAKPKKA